MSKQKLTPWFPARERPVRDGIYECNRLEAGNRRVTRMLMWTGGQGLHGWSYTDDGVDSMCKPGEPAIMWEADGDKWRGLQGDEHSMQIGASAYLVEFGEGPDRPGDDE
jgi:hypothetical protein